MLPWLCRDIPQCLSATGWIRNEPTVRVCKGAGAAACACCMHACMSRGHITTLPAATELARHGLISRQGECARSEWRAVLALRGWLSPTVCAVAHRNSSQLERRSAGSCPLAWVYKGQEWRARAVRESQEPRWGKARGGTPPERCTSAAISRLAFFPCQRRAPGRLVGFSHGPAYHSSTLQGLQGHACTLQATKLSRAAETRMSKMRRWSYWFPYR